MGFDNNKLKERKEPILGKIVPMAPPYKEKMEGFIDLTEHR